VGPVSTQPKLIRWNCDRFADSAYLGKWYIGSIMEIGDHWSAAITLPNNAERTEHPTREAAQDYAEQRVREFLDFTQLPGRI
jgi:hypothetical protein